MVSRGAYRFNDVQSGSLLLVEGIDDARFFDAFLKSLSIGHVQIASVDGKDNFAPFLKNTLITARGYPNLRRLVLVRDADDNANAAYQSLQSALNGADLPVPSDSFLAWAQGQPSVSVAILPDGKSPGNLEDLCLQSIEGNHEGMNDLKCVDGYLLCRNPASIPESKHSKARLHSYLAVADEPGRRLGEAADAGVWDWNSEALRPLAGFLSQL